MPRAYLALDRWQVRGTHDFCTTNWTWHGTEDSLALMLSEGLEELAALLA